MRPCAPPLRPALAPPPLRPLRSARKGRRGARHRLTSGCHFLVISWSLLGHFLSSTSTNSASTTLSLPLSSGFCWPSVGGCCAPGGGVLLYMASASLWLAVVRRSTAALILSASFSLRTFLVSSRAASISLASASPSLERCSLRVFSTL